MDYEKESGILEEKRCDEILECFEGCLLETYEKKEEIKRLGIEKMFSLFKNMFKSSYDVDKVKAQSFEHVMKYGSNGDKIRALFIKYFEDDKLFLYNYPNDIKEECNNIVESSINYEGYDLRIYLNSIIEIYINIWLEEAQYGEKLALKKKQLIFKDEYGDDDSSKWNQELLNFIDKRASTLDSFILKRIPKEILEIVEQNDRNNNTKVSIATLSPIAMLDYFGQNESKQYLASIIDSQLNVFSNRLAYVENSNSDIGQITDPYEYEKGISDIFRKNGWETQVTSASGDQGADVIALKNNRKIVIQCKLYSSPVGNKAVQEINAALTYYNANLAIVVTNNSFTYSARQLANSLGVHLIHHSEIAKLDKELFGKAINENNQNYLDKNKGFWIDTEFGLIWERKTDENIVHRYVWSDKHICDLYDSDLDIDQSKDLTDDVKDAFSYVAKLNRINYGGFNDWRLPTIEELKTLLTINESELKGLDNKYWYTKEALSSNTAYSYWSSTDDCLESNQVETANFFLGSVLSEEKNTPTHVRCVRGELIKKVSISSSIKTWIDSETSLMWEVKSDESKNHHYVFSREYIDKVYCKRLLSDDVKDAFSYVAKLNRINYGGFNDWRLPTIEELETILTDKVTLTNNIECRQTLIKEALSKNATTSYWSSTVRRNSEKEYVMNMNFEPSIFPGAHECYKESSISILCVREV